MKKNVFVLLIASLTVSSLFAQTNQDDEKEFTGFSKGDFVITGGVSFNSIEVGNNESNVFTITPKAGHFVSNNIMAGLLFGFSSEKREVDFEFSFGSSEAKITTIAPGVFGRYYFTPENRFSFFTELSLNYIKTKTKVDESGIIIIGDPFNPEPISTEFSFDSEGFSGRFTPGINYFISDSFSLEAALGIISYTSINNDTPNTNSSDSFNISLDLSNINIGLIYRF